MDQTITAPDVGKKDGLAIIGARLRAQDNRCTAAPRFCVQIKRREVGYDTAYTTGLCWHHVEKERTQYDDDKGFQVPKERGWERSGYKDHWETVMVAFTEKGCAECPELNGHNDRRRAFRGEVQHLRRVVQSLSRDARYSRTPEGEPGIRWKPDLKIT